MTFARNVTEQAERRSSEQNRKFHAICRDFGRAKLMWHNKVRDADDWKLLLVSGHAAATGRPSELVAGLEGELVQLRESTAHMSKPRSSSLIEYALAYAAHLNVKLHEYEGETA